MKNKERPWNSRPSSRGCDWGAKELKGVMPLRKSSSGKGSGQASVKTAGKGSAKLVPKASISDTVRRFQKQYPDAICALHHSSPEELLIATILSAQCTDARVNMVTPHLFKTFSVPQGLAQAKVEDIEEVIRSTGFYKNKAKNIKACCERLVEAYGGRVPQNMEQLVALPGVGRKTANVVLGNAFNLTTGVVVDTHVARLSYRLGWTDSENPERIEKDLQKQIPEKYWIEIPHWLIEHGRQICKARRPLCESCFLKDICPKRGVALKKTLRSKTL